MISHRHRCIYVKVPKCAGTSVLDWFVTHGGGRHSFRPDCNRERLFGVARVDGAPLSFIGSMGDMAAPGRLRGLAR